MSNFEYSKATLDWIKAGEEREEEAHREYLKRKKFEEELQWHKKLYRQLIKITLSFY